MYFNYLSKLIKKAKAIFLLVAILFTQLLYAQPPGNALRFDGNDDYVALPNGVVSSLNGDYTIETWFLMNGFNIWQRVFDFGNLTNNYVFFSPSSGYGSLPRFAIRTTSITEQLITGTSVLQTGRWHHVAITYNAATTTATMYINGVQVGQNTGITLKLSDLGVTTQSWLGRSQFGADPYFNGSIDEFRIWNVQKTAGEIQTSMYNTVANNATGLFSYYNFDIGTAGGNNAGLTTLTDLTSNANHGTLMSGFALTGATSNWIESYAMVAPTPTAASNINATSFTANWTAPPFGIAESYLLDVSSTSNFTVPVAGSPFTIAAPTTSQNITSLTSSTTYYYRLRANKSSVNLQGAYSPTFTTATFSSNANLAGLTISTGSLSPDFDAAILSYTSGVSDVINNTTITPTVAQANATIQVQVNGGGFTTVASGNASNVLLLNTGSNTIDVQVTAQDGATTKTYTITVTKSAAANANLASLNISVGSLTPSFNTAVSNYVDSVSTITNSLTVTPTASALNAIIKVRINGGVYAIVNSGDPSATLNLNSGNNTIDVQVTAEDGVTIRVYSIVVYKNALLMHLDAANASSYSGSGINWTDLSTLNNHTVLTNGPTYSASNGGAIVFDGSNDYAVVNNNANILSNTAYTKIAWIYPTSFATYNNIISGGSANGFGQHALFMGGTNRLFAGHNGSWYTVASNTTFDANKWYCVAVTFSNTTGWKLYINGVEEASSASTASYAGIGNMFIGAFDGGSVFSGNIAVAQVYNTALSSQAIVNNYNSVKERYLSDANLTALSLSAGSLSPVFSTNTTAYTAPTNSASITVTPTSSAANALIQVRVNGGSYATVSSGNASGALALNFGSNTIDVNVTAQDGTTIKNYTITVTRTVSTNANLLTLVTSVGTLNPAFDIATTVYTVNVSNATNSITVTPTVEDATATIEVKVNNNSYATIISGNASASLALNVASNTVFVKVTAQNGTTIKTYTLTVIRAYDTPPTITSFTPMFGEVGTAVTITGTNFSTTNTNNIVFFGATKATVTNASATSLTITVPVETSYQNISVTNLETALTAHSKLPFLVTYSSGIIGFAPTQRVTTSLQMYISSVIKDIDGDGKPDIISSATTSEGIAVLRNIATTGVLDSSSFAAPVSFNVSNINAFSIAVEDIDGDGKPDILSTNPQVGPLPLGISVLKNISTPGTINSSSFAPRVSFTTNAIPGSSDQLLLNDIDGDGKPEVIILTYSYGTPSKIVILQNTSTQGVIDSLSFANRIEIPLSQSFSNIAIGDVDGDGKKDIVISQVSNLTVLRNITSPGVITANSFEPEVKLFANGSASSFKLVDLDRDGKLDIILGQNLFYKNIATPGSISINSFEPSVAISGLSVSNNSKFADLNGDGQLEIISTASATATKVYINSSVGNVITSNSFNDHVTLPAYSNFHIADMDGDGKSDIIGLMNSRDGVYLNVKEFDLLRNGEQFNVWKGTTSIDWAEPTNWSLNAVPQATDYALIKDNTAFSPTINGTHLVKELAIGTNRITLNGTLKIAGNFLNVVGDLLTQPSSTLEFNGTVNQRLYVSNYSSTKVNNLTLNNPSIVRLYGVLYIHETFAMNAGTLAKSPQNSYLILKSTARVAPVLGNILTEFLVERYIPAGKRSFRFLAPTVTSSGSIASNWQNTFSQGFGTHITGSTSGANGFDATLTGNPSLYLFNNATQSWGAISNTNVNKLNVGYGYRLLIRGDRSFNLNDPNPSTTNSAATLAALGTPIFGNITFRNTASSPAFLPTLAGNASEFSFIGNSYVSSIDWSALGRTGLTGYYYIWDPTIGTRGAYVSCFTDGTKSNPSSNVTAAIQAGQAFFVQNTSSVSARELLITEANKVTEITNVFRTQSVNGKLAIQLFLTANSAIDSTSQDGALVLFNTAFDNTVNDDDAVKFNNQDENIAIKRGNSLMSIERRNVPFNPKDTIFLKLWQTTQSNYRFKIDASNFDSNLTAFLVDNYLQTETALNLAGIVNINFDINSNVTSQQTDRFSIVFKSANVLPVTITAIKAVEKNSGIQVEWSTINEINMLNYEVEKSTNGIEFTTVGTVQANSLFTYNWFDANAIKGNNYYRVKAVDKNGTYQYTQIVLVKMGSIKNVITVLGNPIKNKKIVLQFQHVDKGSFKITIVNNLGQQIAAKTIIHNGGNATIAIPLNTVVAGTYQLKIINGNTINETKTIVVE